MGGAKSRTLYGKQLEVYYHTPFTEVGEVVDQSTIICHLLRWGRKRVKEEGREEEVSEIFTCLYIHTHGDQMDPFNQKPRHSQLHITTTL